MFACIYYIYILISLPMLIVYNLEIAYIYIYIVHIYLLKGAEGIYLASQARCVPASLRRFSQPWASSSLSWALPSRAFTFVWGDFSFGSLAGLGLLGSGFGSLHGSWPLSMSSRSCLRDCVQGEVPRQTTIHCNQAAAAAQ